MKTYSTVSDSYLDGFRRRVKAVRAVLDGETAVSTKLVGKLEMLASAHESGDRIDLEGFDSEGKKLLTRAQNEVRILYDLKDRREHLAEFEGVFPKGDFVLNRLKSLIDKVEGRLRAGKDYHHEYNYLKSDWSKLYASVEAHAKRHMREKENQERLRMEREHGQL